jgi:hypothetical protein
VVAAGGGAGGWLGGRDGVRALLRWAAGFGRLVGRGWFNSAGNPTSIGHMHDCLQRLLALFRRDSTRPLDAPSPPLNSHHPTKQAPTTCDSSCQTDQSAPTPSSPTKTSRDYGCQAGFTPSNTTTAAQATTTSRDGGCQATATHSDGGCQAGHTPSTASYGCQASFDEPRAPPRAPSPSFFRGWTSPSKVPTAPTAIIDTPSTCKPATTSDRTAAAADQTAARRTATTSPPDTPSPSTPKVARLAVSTNPQSPVPTTKAPASPRCATKIPASPPASPRAAPKSPAISPRRRPAALQPNNAPSPASSTAATFNDLKARLAAVPAALNLPACILQQPAATHTAPSDPATNPADTNADCCARCDAKLAAACAAAARDAAALLKSLDAADVAAARALHAAAGPAGDDGALLDNIIVTLTGGRASSLSDLLSQSGVATADGRAALESTIKMLTTLDNWQSMGRMLYEAHLTEIGCGPAPSTSTVTSSSSKKPGRVSQVGDLLPEDEARAFWLSGTPAPRCEAPPASTPASTTTSSTNTDNTTSSSVGPAAPILDNSSGPGAVCCPACLRPGRLDLGMAGLSPGSRSGSVVVVRASGGVLATAIPAGLRRSGRSSSGGSGGSLSCSSGGSISSVLQAILESI